ncbi:MAG: sigma 54-interacting transcriptional regulator, partial [Methanococcoides sp.]|nr:sigma 54-interacting transcriptional regulator [Methanococcoides sp.]
VRFSAELKKLVLFAITGLALLGSAPICPAQQEESRPKRVLVLYTYEHGSPWETVIDDSLRTTLKSKSTAPIELHVEHTDRVAHPNDIIQEKLVDLYRRKYSYPKMDVIIGYGDEAADILLKYGDELFPEIPIILVTVEQKTVQRDLLKPNMTSLLWGIDIKGTVGLIQEILPEIRHLFVISGSAVTDRALIKLTREALAGYKGGLEIHYLTDITEADLLEKVTQLPKHSVLYYLAFGRDADGKTFVPHEVMATVSERANAPTFGLVDTYLGHGIVGGLLVSAELQGQRCAEIALRILDGQPPKDILPVRMLNVPKFDWRQLKRWGISEDRLPSGSVVEYKVWSLWEERKREIIAGIALIIFQALIIASFFIQRARRNRAVEALTYEKTRLAEAQRIAHLGNWEWNIVTNKLSWSGEVYRIFGIEPHEFGSTYEDFLDMVHPDDRKAVEHAVHKALADPNVRYKIEHRIVRPDASERIVHEMGEVTFDDGGRPILMIGTVLDITERKRMAEQLEERLEEIEKLRQRLEAESTFLQKEIKLEHNFEGIIGNSNALKALLLQVEQVARTNSGVLILGETGTGKELIARSIHSTSLRKHRPLIKVNCADLPPNLIENELFGHEKGSFTGAIERHKGRFEVSHGTTLFLDEIGELPLELQTKLLRVLESGEFERVGSSRTFKVDVRIIAATNRDLEAEIEKGRFREDLWYRLSVFPITVPPLRQRKEDIPLLVNFFLKRFNKEMGKTITSVPKAIMDSLLAYRWPGNVRELKNVIERAVITTHGTTLKLMSEFKLEKETAGPKPQRKGLADIEYQFILETLEKTRWKIEGPGGAARILELKPSTLRYRMKKLGIQRP